MADQARLLQDIARFQNTAEEEKKILTANLQAEKDSLIAERARLLDDIWRLQNTAEEEKKLLAANLQAEKDSLIAERARLLDDIWRLQNIAEEEKKILTAKLQAERESLMAEQIRVRQKKNAQLQVLSQRLRSLNQDKETLSATLKQLVQDKETLAATLNRIYDSHGWKALLAYYQLRNSIFPPGSKRQDFAKRVFHLLLGDKKKHLAPNTTSHQFISPTHNRRSPGPGPLDVAACTIISKNYIALCTHARSHSFHKFHPDVPFFVLLVDRVDGYFQPEVEPFYTIGIEDLDIPDHYGFCFKYTILELNTAAKPYFLSHLFDKHGVSKTYLLRPRHSNF